MSLLDDVSIVVTPNGYKAGELYAVIPSNGDADMDVTRATAATRVDENGLVNYAEVVSDTELVTNGDFSTDSDWGKFDGTTISGGAINFNVTNTGTKANQTNVMTSGLLYKVTFEISNYVGGNIYMSGWSIPLAERTEQSNGVFSFYAEASGSTFTIGTTSSSTQLSIDSISVKEIQRDNVPRIDYTGGGCPHILAEPQRTNIVFPSAVAVTQTRTVSATEYTLSFYGTGSVVLSGTHSATLNGTSVNNRVTLSFTPTAGSLTLTISGTVTNIQLEVGSYATSLIPTSGGTVTRNQDIFTRDGIGSLINSTEGTIFVEMAALANDSTNRYISINDGSSTNRIIFKFGTSSNNISALGLGTATSFSLSYSSATITNMNKIALKYKVNDCALWVNGVEVATDTTFTAYTANTLNQINFSNYASSGQFLDAKVKQLQVYKTALTDTQLAALTS